jgi:hypothetical protein
MGATIKKKALQKQSLARIVWAVEVRDKTNKEWHIVELDGLLGMVETRRSAISIAEHQRDLLTDIDHDNFMKIQYRVSRMEIKWSGGRSR